jgi:hypothetical protein
MPWAPPDRVCSNRATFVRCTSRRKPWRCRQAPKQMLALLRQAVTGAAAKDGSRFGCLMRPDSSVPRHIARTRVVVSDPHLGPGPGRLVADSGRSRPLSAVVKKGAIGCAGRGVAGEAHEGPAAGDVDGCAGDTACGVGEEEDAQFVHPAGQAEHAGERAEAGAVPRRIPSWPGSCTKLPRCGWFPASGT